MLIIEKFILSELIYRGDFVFTVLSSLLNHLKRNAWLYLGHCVGYGDFESIVSSLGHYIFV